MNYRSNILRVQAIILSMLLLFGVIGAAPANAQQPQGEKPQAQATGKLDFTYIAVLGDSLSQSYHDGVLHADAQNQNYLTLLSKTINFDLRQALIAEPGGFGDRFSLKDPSKPVVPLNAQTFLNLTLPPVRQSSGRVDTNLRVNNFAIGGAKVTDIINARPDPASPNTALFASLGIPFLNDNPPVRRSQLEMLETMVPSPTVAILFIGGNDALGAASNSDLSRLTPADQFLADYETIVKRTKAAGANMILVTVPDVTNVAAFISGKDLMAFIPIPADMFVKKTGINPDDYVTLRAFASLIDIVFGRSTGPVPENQILRKKMAKTISKTIKKYNAGIVKIAKRENFPVVDLNGFLNKASSKDGFVIPGVGKLSTKYFGGVASFDGVHITNTANAVLANAFLDAINKYSGSTYPMIDVTPIAQADPQVPKSSTAVEPLAAPSAQEWDAAKPQLKAMGDALNRLFGVNQ